MDPAEKSGPRKLINIQELPPLNSRAVHPNKPGARQKCQTCVDEHGAPGKTQTLKEVYSSEFPSIREIWSCWREASEESVR